MTSASRRIRRANDPAVIARKQRHAAEAYAAAIVSTRTGDLSGFFDRPLTNGEIASGQRDDLFDAAYELGIDLPGMSDVPA